MVNKIEFASNCMSVNSSSIPLDSLPQWFLNKKIAGRETPITKHKNRKQIPYANCVFCVD